MNSKVEVLLSTYNGEKFLNDQINSLIAQRDVDIEILIRDDGSSDSTVSMLAAWEKEGVLSWYSGPNLKPAKSFMDLLKKSPYADYYAFCDQDDYWLPDKLSTAVSMLQDYQSRPALYFCQTQLADAHLNKIDSVVIRPYLTLGEALVYQFVGGCTMVMNSKLRDILLQYDPSYLPMHDVWVYNIALAIGAKVVFDPVPHILYRQHGGNVIGQTAHDSKEWGKRIKGFLNGNRNARSNFANEIYRGYKKEMPIANLKLIEKYLKGKNNILTRCNILFDQHYKCSDKKTYCLFKLAVLLNTY